MVETPSLPSEKETQRQYRILQQTLSAHAALRDGYDFKAKTTEVLLIICAAIFCATTFVDDTFYADLGVSPQIGKFGVGIASVLAFASSLAILVVNWRGSATLHGKATEKWSSALEEFRKRRGADGAWSEEDRATLSAAYWEAAANSTAIPERSFNRLKGRHLRKVEVSKLISEYPGCPRVVLALKVRARDTNRALRRSDQETQGEDNAKE